jgi:hypothetical protein
MSAQEQRDKLATIATLPEGELRGWWRYVCVINRRPEFDGERAALLARARQIGISFNEVSA